ncbi:MAG: hypothetical protein ACI8S6_004558 [Myxococcota bacterium]|jgi:hypothetical protein
MTIVTTILSTVPLLLVLLAGGALAATRLAAHPTPAKLSLVGLTLLLLAFIAGQAISSLLFRFGYESISYETFMAISQLSWSATNLVTMLGIIAMAAAAWSGRGELT